MNLNLITDRTAKDLIDDTDRAYIDYTDLNRIGNAVAYLSDRLTAAGYTVNTNPKNDWAITDIRDQEHMTILQQDLQTLRDALAAMPSTPSVPAVTFDSIANANQIEQILVDTQRLVEGMIEQYRYCGDDLIAGEE